MLRLTPLLLSLLASTAGADTVGPYTFTPVDAAANVNAPNGSWGWVNVVNTYISVNDAMTSVPVWDAGYVNPAQGHIMEWTFAGGVTNAPGDDIVLFELRYDVGDFTMSSDYDGFAATTQVTGWVDTGTGGNYWFNGAGPYVADVWGGTIDLSDLGVPDGATVYAVRTIAMNVATDPAGMGALSPVGGEACDGVDNNLDGQIDEGHPDTDLDGVADCVDICPFGDDGADADGDGTPDACDVCPFLPGETDADGDGDWSCTDCDDSDPLVQSIDQDADGWSTCLGDCADLDPAIFPGATELANGVDDDCDGIVDEATDWYDDDGDGVAEDGGDCNDADPAIHPAAPEICDGIDNDCDGLIDEDTECTDDDGDGFCEGPACVDGSSPGDCNDGDPAVSPVAVEIPGNGIDDDCDPLTVDGYADADGDGFAEEAGDCDDSDPAVFPGAPEVADGVDNDCDGIVDEGTEAYDDDGDGFSELDGDCNDADDQIGPGGTESLNGLDDDCDGVVDEDTEVTDDDGDGFTELEGDCDDADPSVSPMGTESDNGVDDDCDGAVDEDFVDVDGDGYTPAEGDCRDDLGWVNPGRGEMCDDQLDNDCNGEVDEGCANPPVTADKAGGACGCQTGGSGGALGLLVLLGALGVRRRR